MSPKSRKRKSKNTRVGATKSGHAPLIPVSATKNLSLAHCSGILRQRHSFADLRGLEKSLVPLRDLGNMYGFDKLCLTGSEPIMNGECGPRYHLTFDKRFIIKTLTREEVEEMHHILKHNLDHEGPTVQREASEKQPPTCKDNDFVSESQEMYIGHENKAELLEIVRCDEEFLLKNNLMDYRLLLGVHDADQGGNASGVEEESVETGGETDSVNSDNSPPESPGIVNSENKDPNAPSLFAHAVEMPMPSSDNARDKSTDIHYGAKEHIMKTFIDMNERILGKFKGLLNEKGVLDLCDVFRGGLCAIVGDNFDQQFDLIRRFGSATTTIADPGATQASSLVKAQQMLASRDDAAAKYLKHMTHLSALTPEDVLKDVRPQLDEYLVYEPRFDYSFLLEYIKMLRVLFPCECDYEVIHEVRDIKEMPRDIAKVVKKDPDTGEVKVVLVVKGRLSAEHYCQDISLVEDNAEYYCFLVAQSILDDGGTLFPDHIYWLAFRGAHFACGSFREDCFDRLWPADEENFQDIRSDAAAMVIIEFARQVASEPKSQSEVKKLAEELAQLYPATE